MEMNETNELNEINELTVREVRKRFSRIGWCYVVFLVVSGAAQMLLGMVLAVTGVFDMPRWQWIQTPLSLGAMYCIGLPCFLKMMEIVPDDGGGDGRVRLPKKELLIMLVVCLGATYIGSYVGNGISFLVSLFREEPLVNTLTESIAGVGGWSTVLNLAVVILISPAVEEYMFRKMLIDRILICGDKTAILMSGLMFGVFHGNFFQFFYAFMLGCLFAYVYIRSRNWKYCYFLHGAVNFTGSALPLGVLAAAEKLSGSAGESLMYAYAVFVLACISAGISLVLVYRHKLVFEPGSVKALDGHRFRALFCSAGMAAFFLICGLEFLL